MLNDLAFAALGGILVAVVMIFLMRRAFDSILKGFLGW